jgi:hypothetical protein
MMPDIAARIAITRSMSRFVNGIAPHQTIFIHDQKSSEVSITESIEFHAVSYAIP